MIQTKRLQLQPMSDRDADAAVALLTDNVVKQTYMLPDFESREQALSLFSRLVALSHMEERFVRGIYLNGEWIGMLNDVGVEGGCIELGYALLPRYYGQGYATEALCGAIEALFTRGYTEIRAGAFEGNDASLRVMQKSGMQRIDYTEEIEYRGSVHHCIFYAIKK
jgi:RimJ/RimL family protein N-acetyltransferase